MVRRLNQIVLVLLLLGSSHVSAAVDQINSYHDTLTGLVWQYPHDWTSKKASIPISTETTPHHIQQRVILTPHDDSSTQFMIDTWFHAQDLDLTAWYKRYDAANYSPQVIVQSAPTISLLGYLSLLLIDPPSQTQRGSINVLIQLDDQIVRIAYPLTDGGQHQTEFLALLQSFAHAEAPSRVSRLPTRDQLPAIAPESPTSSCCGWVDPNSNTYPCNGGNCTWWAKYKRPDIGNYWGDALGWRNRARQEGFAVDTVAQVGAIAVYQPNVYIGQGLRAGPDGHVAYVEAVGTNGSFTISDMSNQRGCQYGNNGVFTIQSQQTNNENLVFIYTSIVSAPSQQNLVLNGDFSAGTTNWWKYGDASWAIVDQGLNFRRNPGGTGGSVGQNLAYQFAANTPIEAQFDLGNSSGVTKHIGVFIRHESSWDQPIHCGFSLPPYSPMQRFSIRGRTGNVVWNKLTFEVWADPPDGIPDVRMDNVAITYRTDIAISVKTCIAPAPSQQNLVRNADFSAGTADWWRYGDASWGIVDQALNFRRNPGGDGGSVGQNLPYRLNPNAPIEVQFDLGNPSGVTKYAGVFLRHSSSWDQPIHCGFTLPPYSPMQRYVVRGRSGSVVWNELTFEVWADPPDGTSDLRMDNVSIAYRPELVVPATTCIAPAPSQQNLVRNADFSAGTADWWRYGDASWGIVDQALNFRRNPGGDGGSVGQNLPYRLNPNAPIEVQFDLGNPSGVTKYAGVFIRHSLSWDQPIHCGFMLPAYSPMQRYVVRGRSGSVVWNELTFEVWADPPDGFSDLRMDNVSIAYRSDLAINATTCIAPTANQEQPNQCLVQIDQGAQFTANLNVNLEFRVDQAATMRVSNQPLDSSIAWQPYQASLDWLLASSLLGNNRTVYAEFRDSQGTMLCAGHELRDDIRLDTTAPNLIEMQVYPFAASLGLAITASDDPTGSGINAVQVSSRSDFNGSIWLPYSPVIDLEGQPNSTLYVRVRDSVGNSSAAQSIAVSTQQTYRLYLPMTSDQ